MRQIHTDSFSSEDNEKPISCLRGKTGAGVLWEETIRRNKPRLTGAQKLVVKKVEHYLHVFIMTDSVGKYFTL